MHVEKQTELRRSKLNIFYHLFEVTLENGFNISFLLVVWISKEVHHAYVETIFVVYWMPNLKLVGKPISQSPQAFNLCWCNAVESHRNPNIKYIDSFQHHSVWRCSLGP